MRGSPKKKQQASDYVLPMIKHQEGNTCVFWDVEDYPIDGDLDSETVYQKMEEDLRKQGYFGKLSIHFFVGKDKVPAGYSDEQIKITVFPDGDQNARIFDMLVHIYVWALRNRPPSNILLLSKNVGEFCSSIYLENVYDREYGLLLSDPNPDWLLPRESSALLFPSLLTGETTTASPSRKLKYADTVAD